MPAIFSRRNALIKQEREPRRTKERLQARLRATGPDKLEKETDFKRRVKNAVKWTNANEASYFKKMVDSMPKRFAEAKLLKGARTSY